MMGSCLNGISTTVVVNVVVASGCSVKLQIVCVKFPFLAGCMG